MKNKISSNRLSMKQLQAWESLGYGMFIHFGMSTFSGCELPTGEEDLSLYNPIDLDVEQWIKTAKEAGMKYAVLTTKHVAGHALWASKYSDYTIANSPNKVDVLAEFVKQCRKYDIMAGFYYCSWDNHHKFGSLTPSDTYAIDGFKPGIHSFVTREYMEFQTNQITEILTNYGEIGEIWIDIPAVLPRFYREELYHHITKLQPNIIIMMNNGFGDGSNYEYEKAWPSDLIAIERWLPNSQNGHVKNRNIEDVNYYIPAEVCDPIGKEWFFVEHDTPRSDTELLGMYLVSRSRGCNLLLDVPPNQAGVIPQIYVDALKRLRANIEKLGGFI